MSKKLLYLTGILLTLILGIVLYWYLCCRYECKCGKVNPPPPPQAGKCLPFELTGMDYYCFNSFNFRKGGFDHLLPLGDSIIQGIGLLKTKIEGNPGKKLLITGYCMPVEKETSGFPHLGYARANDIKMFLVSKGFDPLSIELRGILQDDWRMEGDIVFGPVAFAMVDTGVLPDSLTLSDWVAFRESLNSPPVTLYYDVNESENDQEQTILTKLAAMNNYLTNMPNGALQITGHTDISGSHARNLLLGQKRADFVGSLLLKNGTDPGRVLTNSKGPDEPAADNSSPEGRAKNRRAVIIIQ